MEQCSHEVYGKYKIYKQYRRRCSIENCHFNSERPVKSRGRQALHTTYQTEWELLQKIRRNVIRVFKREISSLDCELVNRMVLEEYEDTLQKEKKQENEKIDS
jgi:hypothetical protein